MKLNKKGFMMAEVVVVSAIILGVLISIYTSYGKVFRRYGEIINYYNVDGVYTLATMRDKLIKNNNIINTYLSTLSDSGLCLENYVSESGRSGRCYAYLLKSDSLNISTSSDTFDEYLRYLSDTVKFTGNYVMVMELSKGNDKYYYNYLELEA